MTDDVDMDAPQISTLREEETPEPQPNPNRTSKFRVKLLVGEGKRASSASSTPRKAPQGDSDDEEEEDDEEDQLIDDDEEETKAPAPTPAGITPPIMTDKKTTTSKRGGSTAGRARGRGRGSRGGKASRSDAAPPLTATASIDSIGTNVTAGGSISAPPTGSPKKRGGGGAKAGATRGGPRKRAPKQPMAVPLHLRDDAGSISEAYAGTAASSPVPHDDHSPDVHDVPLPASLISSAIAPTVEDMNLEGVPLPSYPLPSRPLAVHPPQKIGTGFAPTIPLDRSGKRVRHWRQANREIRGIGGGRWFTKSWVGDKESDYAAAAAAVAAAMQAIAPGNTDTNVSGLGPLPIPRLPGVTIPGGRGTGKLKMSKADVLSTNPSSRAQSIESVSAIIPKKRTNSQMSTAETSALSAPPA